MDTANIAAIVQGTFIGLALSGVVWAAGLWSLTRATAAAIAIAPPSWRDRYASRYETQHRVRDAFLSRGTFLWVAAATGIFLVLAILDLLLVVQLGVAAALAVWMTVAGKEGRREDEAEALAEGLEPVPPNRGLRWWYDGSYPVTTFGLFAAACFVARLLVDLASD